MSTSLAELQERFQARLLKGDDAILPHLNAGGPFLKAYEYAYRARLVEILSEDFEGLHTLLGDEWFFSTMRSYVDAHPSTSPSARWLGRSVADWLRTSEDWATNSMVSSMAAFEWMLGLAFDAPNAALIEMGAVGAVPPEAWPMLTFTLHPALNTAVLDFDVSVFYRAVKAGVDPEAPPVAYDSPVTWAAWRHPDSLMVMYRALDADEAAALRAAREGQTFDALCEIIADCTDADEAAVRAAGLLRVWIESGWIIGLDANGMSW